MCIQNTGGVQYVPGGCTSGFNHVVKDDFPTRLLQIKGTFKSINFKVKKVMPCLNTIDVM
jgi:hypothetical protein